MRVDALNEKELKAKTPIEASWHNDYKDSAYVHVANVPFRMTEGDILILFSQYGNPVHVHLFRHKVTGKSLGHGYVKYEDQRSTVLAVDNFNGIRIADRILAVSHHRYHPPPESVPALSVLYDDERLEGLG